MLDKHLLSNVRIMVLSGVLFCFFCALVIQLWNVQVRGGESHRSAASRQSVRNIRIPSVRGNIYSSDGVLLAGNKVIYEVVFHLSEMRQPGKRSKMIGYVLEQAGKVSMFLKMECTLTADDIQKHMRNSPGLPLTVVSGLSKESLARAVELSAEIPGMEILASPVRYYPHGKLAGHLIGYTGRDDPNSALDRSGFYYYIPDTVGRAGLEKVLDSWDFEKASDERVAEEDPDSPPEIRQRKALLRGFPGKKLVVVDTRGFVREQIGEPIPAENGKDVVLTLNFRAQKIAEKLLRGMTGAIVVMDAENGDIVAMASSPSYDPSVFVPRISRENYRKLTSDPGKPLFARASMGAFSPGSVVKPLVALARQVHGGKAEDMIRCDGRTFFGLTPVACWIGAPGHGMVSMQDAIAQSCNDYFIETGLFCGIDELKRIYSSAGIGKKTGFLLPETSGHLPAGKVRKSPQWMPFDTGLVSIGQGDILVSPLQVACYTSALANGGKLWKPQILKNIIHEGRTVYTRKNELRGTLAGTPEMLEVIRAGMHRAVNDYNGSAKRARTPMIDLSGKTGTAEVGSGRKKYKNTWFIGFGRDLRDEAHPGKLYAVAVLVEHGVSGGKTCAPIAASFFENFLME